MQTQRNFRFLRKPAVFFLWLVTTTTTTTTTMSSKTDDVINIVWLAPYATVDDGIRATFNASSSLAGLALAVYKVGSERLMAGMKFNVTWLDSDCYAKTSIGELATVVRDLTNLPDLILGPPCTSSMQPVADLASYLNIPDFGWMSSDHRLDNKTRASTLVRLMPPLSDLGNLLIAVCGRFIWNRVAMISSTGPMTTAVSDFFKELLREDSDFYLVRHFSGIMRQSTDAAIIRRLSLITEEARIIFLVIPETEVRRYMLHAHDMGMTSGDYQFLYVQPYISDDDEVDRIRSQQFWKRYDGRDDEARNAYKSLIVVTYSFILRWKINNAETAAITDDVFSGYRNDMPPYAEPDRYSRFLHDAFYLYCLDYNQSTAFNLTTSGEDIFKIASQLRFTDKNDAWTLKIQMSHNTYVSIEDKSQFIMTERGQIEVKGKGLMKTYWLEGKVEVDEGPIDVHTKTRNPSMVNLHNFSMEEFFNPHATTHSSVPSTPATAGTSEEKVTQQPKEEGSGRPVIRVSGDGDGGTEVPELYERESSGLNILRQFSSKPPKLKMVDETTVLH